MKVVLRKDVPTLGKSGEVKDVADGYARNYLIPRGLAAPATRTELANVQAHSQAEARQQARQDAEHRELANRIQETTVVVRARTGEQGRLYGSVTSAEVAEALSRTLGHTIDKRAVELEEPLRHLGKHTVRVHVAPRVSANATVDVQPEESK